jgi:AhpD family alkylhydroperoxidase
MEERLNLQETAPDAVRAVMGLERYSRGAVEEPLLNLVKLRASMLNGCTYCVDMHSREALAAGEDPRRLFGLAAWTEAPFYSKSERAALALTDAVTRIGDAGVNDEVWADACAEFEPQQLAGLVIAIATINVWNRIGISLRLQPPAVQAAENHSIAR